MIYFFDFQFVLLKILQDICHYEIHIKYTVKSTVMLKSLNNMKKMNFILLFLIQ